jgi:raffinose/stachyose/melibiose transport system substrate-binding protein
MKIITLLSIGVISIGLMGCSGGAQSNSAGTQKGPVTLTLWDIWDSSSDGNTAPFNKAVADFQAENPNIKLNVVGQDSSAYFQKLQIALAANQGPDIIYCQGAGVMKPFVDGGKLEPLNSYIDKDGVKNKLITGSLNNFTFNNKVYALPTTIAIGTLYCNTDLFKQYGVKLPDTLDDFNNAVKVFSSKGISPMIVGGKDQWPASMYYDILALREAGVQGCADVLNKTASWDQPAFVAAAKTLQDLAKNNAFNSSFLALGWDEAQQEFLQGKGAMLFNGSWVSSVTEADDSPIKGKVVAMQFPTFPGTPGKATDFLGGANDSFAMSSITKNKEEAFKAIEGITQDMAKESYLAGSGLPAWKLGKVDTSKINPLMVQQEKLINGSTGMRLWFDTTLGGAGGSVHYSLTMELLANKITPEDFAKQSQAQINEK